MHDPAALTCRRRSLPPDAAAQARRRPRRARAAARRAYDRDAGKRGNSLHRRAQDCVGSQVAYLTPPARLSGELARPARPARDVGLIDATGRPTTVSVQRSSWLFCVDESAGKRG